MRNLSFDFYFSFWSVQSVDTVLFLTREATQLCDFVPGTNWHKWASQIVNFTLILRFGLSDNLAWPVVSVCSLMFATSKRLLQIQTFLRFFFQDILTKCKVSPSYLSINQNFLRLFPWISRHFKKILSFLFKPNLTN